MDFKTPHCVITALEKQVKHGIYGYSEPDSEYIEAITAWFTRRFNWRPSPNWLIKTPGVVTAIFIAVRALTAPGDAVIIQQPVYYPFMESVEQNNRKLIINELIQQGDGKYEINFQDFEDKIKTEHVKLFILCNPHNPVGRVWTRAELERLGEICLRHNVLVISDEIHQDFIYPNHRHQVFADISNDLQNITVTCTSPSKTFNLAGLQISHIFIADDDLRARYRDEYARSGLSQVGVMGLVAARAAYSGGEAWLESLLKYLDGNMALIESHTANLPGVAFTRPEGTYLAWLDFRKSGVAPEKLDAFLTERAGLWLSDGRSFGAGGAGRMRLNAACVADTLREGLRRLNAALTGE
jgi:cystathionine beta-lyase